MTDALIIIDMQQGSFGPRRHATTPPAWCNG